MRKSVVPLALLLALLVGCGSTTPSSASKRSSRPTASSASATGSPTTLSIVSAPAATTSGTADPNATGTILMVKIYVGDLDKAEQFYGAVFGAKRALEIGAGAHIVTFPKGGPGLVLLKAGASTAHQKGAFIIQVPNLAVAEAAALANGATKQGTFAGAPAGQAAKSIDLLDPWGNQIEILQIG